MCEVCEYESAIDIADSITSIADRLDEENNSERATEFADSVRNKALGMKEWMVAKKHTTEKMRKALDNMLNGAERWVEGGTTPF